jgi:hypothetical protein
MAVKLRFRRALAAVTFVGYFFVCITVGARDGGSEPSDAFDIEYSHWLPGGCSTSHTADVLCWMALQARSGTGELVGSVVFGQEDSSRFLVIEALRSMDRMSLVLAIDGVSLSKRPIACRAGDQFCSVVLAVDNRLLNRLMNGGALTVEVQGVRMLRFPLQDFAQSRHMLM